MKVRTRLFLVFLAIIGIGFASLLVWIERTAQPLYLASLEDDLVETAAILATYLERESRNGEMDLEMLGGLVNSANQRRLNAQIYGRNKDFANFRVTVANRSGRVIYDSKDGAWVGSDFSEWNDVARTLKGQYGARATKVEGRSEKILALFVALPVVIDGRLAGALTVSKPTTVAHSYWPSARRQIFLGLGLIALLCFLVGLAISHWVTQPIRKLTHYSEAVARGSRVGLPSLGNSDIGVLAKSFDSMRDALDGKKYVEGYVQTLTHEIKSPLSAIRGAAELLNEDMPIDRRSTFLGHIKTETARIQQLIERLLELSSLESRATLGQVVPVDFGVITDELLKDADPIVRAKNLEVRFNRAKAIQVVGEPFLLRLAISNLLQNALAFAPKDGWVSIAFGRSSIRVTDSGPGIPDYAEKRIFNRFYSLPRAETGRKSTGLGLSIVRQVAELHHGGVQLCNAKNAGAQATLWFPIDQVHVADSENVVTN